MLRNFTDEERLQTVQEFDRLDSPVRATQMREEGAPDWWFGDEDASRSTQAAMNTIRKSSA